LRRVIAYFAALGIAFACATTARAIIVIRNPGRNLNPPQGTLAGSGWQWEGDWHGFTGTAIGPNDFLTAAHVGGFPGEAFSYRGRTYRALDATPLPGRDMCVWRVARRMPDWAPLYTGRAEIGKDVVMFGRGTGRGPEVRVDGQRRGWFWGATDDRLSWGRSWVMRLLPARVTGAVNAPGEAFAVPFDADAGPDAGVVSSGDSGGGVFLRDDDGHWKLCGVIFGVENGFSQVKTANSELNAALFDSRGLYRRAVNGAEQFVPPTAPDSFPMESIVSRVSTSGPEIQRAMTTSRTTARRLIELGLLFALPLLAVAGLIGLGLRRRVKQAAISAEDTVP
jgi:hypothetical protein